MARYVSSIGILAHRAVIAIILLISLYGYYSFTDNIANLVEDSRANLEECHANALSILSSLQVFHKYKLRLDTLYNRLTEKSSRDMENLKSKLKSCQDSSDSDKKRIDELEKTWTNQNDTSNPVKNSEIEEILKLKASISELKNQLSDKEDIIKNINVELSSVKKSLVDCQKTIEQYVGVVPIAHYTQNETAFFNRKHKVGQALSFDRGAIQEHSPLKILRGPELMQKLDDAKKRKEEENKDEDLHPDDREKDDDYVNEIRNPEENDYKEGN